MPYIIVNDPMSIEGMGGKDRMMAISISAMGSTRPVMVTGGGSLACRIALMVAAQGADINISLSEDSAPAGRRPQNIES